MALGLGMGRSGCSRCGRRRGGRQCARYSRPITATARITTQDPIIQARRLRTTAILRRHLAILRRRLAILRQRLAMPCRPALPLETQWPTASSVIGHITRKPEPISGPTANVITAPERFFVLRRRSKSFGSLIHGASNSFDANSLQAIKPRK